MKYYALHWAGSYARDFFIILKQYIILSFRGLLLYKGWRFVSPALTRSLSDIYANPLQSRSSVARW